MRTRGDPDGPVGPHGRVCQEARAQARALAVHGCAPRGDGHEQSGGARGLARGGGDGVVARAQPRRHLQEPRQGRLHGGEVRQHLRATPRMDGHGAISRSVTPRRAAGNRDGKN